MTKSRTLLLVVIAIITLAFCQFFIFKDSFLLTTGKGQWIKKADNDVWLGVIDFNEDPLYFRTVFQIEERPKECLWDVRSYGEGMVYVNNRGVGGCENRWNTFELADHLVAGENEIIVKVINKSGPQMLIASSDSIGVHTGPDWTVSGDLKRWFPTELADSTKISRLSRRFPTATTVLKPYFLFSILWLIFTLLLVNRVKLGLTTVYSRIFKNDSRWLWCIAGLWLILSLNNMTQLSLTSGLDASWHYAYTVYIWTYGELPLASDGWQYFRPPFNYILSTLLFSVLESFFSLFTSEEESFTLSHYGLRIIPILCGTAQIYLIYQISRICFRTNETVVKLAVVVGAFLPSHVYISQFVSNEPLSGVVISWLLYRSLKIISSPETLSRSEVITLGVVSGIGLLTKYTSALMIFFVALAILFRLKKNEHTLREQLKTFIYFSVAILLCCGWYFARNWIELGSPTPLGLGGVWLYPGYTTSGQLISLKCFDTPILTATSGLFDGVYASFWLDTHLSGGVTERGIPNWNYEYMAGLAILSIPLSLLMCGGFLRGFRGCWSGELEPRHMIVLAITVFLSVIVWHNLNHPFYCHRKATYAIGLLPAFACLLGMGFEMLPDRFEIKNITIGYLAAWCVIVYAAFFVVS